MKTLFVCIFLCITINSFSQTAVIYPPADTLRYENDYMRYCFMKFSKVHTTGTVMLITGLGISLAGTLSYDPENSEFIFNGKTVMYTGIGISVLGWITQEVSFRWMKKASVKPDGFGIKVYF